jgi:hypothetical protein
MTFTTYEEAQAAMEDLYSEISNIAPLEALDMCHAITLEMARLKKPKRSRRRKPTLH